MEIHIDKLEIHIDKLEIQIDKPEIQIDKLEIQIDTRTCKIRKTQMELQTDTIREIQTYTQQWKTDTARNTDRHTKMENR